MVTTLKDVAGGDSVSKGKNKKKSLKLAVGAAQLGERVNIDNERLNETSSWRVTIKPGDALIVDIAPLNMDLLHPEGAVIKFHDASGAPSDRDDFIAQKRHKLIKGDSVFVDGGTVTTIFESRSLLTWLEKVVTEDSLVAHVDPKKKGAQPAVAELDALLIPHTKTGKKNSVVDVDASDSEGGDAPDEDA